MKFPSFIYIITQETLKFKLVKIVVKIGNVEINGKVVSPCYVLKNNDRVRVITDIMAYGPRKEWEDIVVTTRAKQKIKEWYEKK